MALFRERDISGFAVKVFQDESCFMQDFSFSLCFHVVLDAKSHLIPFL